MCETSEPTLYEKRIAAILSRPPPNRQPSPDQQNVPPRPKSKAPTVTIRKRLEEIDRSLERLEGEGFFVSYPLSPQNEFPTLLTRLPIFRPSKRLRQRNLLNRDNALEFSTPFGSGKRYGPPLTVRDEDTLIAITRLRSKRLYGCLERLPIQIADIYHAGGDDVGVHCVVCSVDQINKELGLTDGGLNYRETLASVKRIGATTLELNLKRHERYLGEVEMGRMLPLIHVQWEAYSQNGLLLILFPPVIARWLEQEYTYINWDIRLQLDDLGKALHRFLSSQPKQYRAEVLKIAETIGYDGPTKNVKPRFRRSLEQLKGLGWLLHYAFTGSGRSIPLVLKTTR